MATMQNERTNLSLPKPMLNISMYLSKPVGMAWSTCILLKAMLCQQFASEICLQRIKLLSICAGIIRPFTSSLCRSCIHLEGEDQDTVGNTRVAAWKMHQALLVVSVE